MSEHPTHHADIAKLMTERTQLHRRSERGNYDRQVVNQIVDEALYCHVGFVYEQQPYVMPTIHTRIGDQLYLHGAAASRMLRAIGEGIPVCVTVTILDGLVLARSAFHHSMNYRSVVILGKASVATDRAEKMRAMEAIVEHMIAGRWNDVRQPSEKELNATRVLKIPTEEASAKFRIGPPLDDEHDYTLPCWAGELPLKLAGGKPVAAPRLGPDVTLPKYLDK